MVLKYKTIMLSAENDTSFGVEGITINHIGIQNLSDTINCEIKITYGDLVQIVKIPPKENWEIGLENEEPLNIPFDKIGFSSDSSGNAICYFSYWEDEV